MVKGKKRSLRASKFLPCRLAALVGFSLTLVLLAACGESTSTSTSLPPTTAPTIAPTTLAPTTPASTTAPIPTATLGNPLAGKTPGASGNAAIPGGTALPGIPDEIKKPFALISADLEKRSKLPASSFQVTSYTQQTFPDSALGCPDPNLMYTQVLTPGYSIQVSAGGQNYDYRTNLAGTHLILCGPNGRPAPTPTP